MPENTALILSPSDECVNVLIYRAPEYDLWKFSLHRGKMSSNYDEVIGVSLNTATSLYKKEELGHLQKLEGE